MGDRTWVELKIKNIDYSSFKDILGERYPLPEKDLSKNSAHSSFYFDDEDYGGDELQDKLANKRLTYIILHGQGDEYDPGIWVSFFGIVSYCITNRDGHIIVTMTPDGSLNNKSLHDAYKTSQLYRWIMCYFENTGNPEYAINLASVRLTGKLAKDIERR